MRYSWVIVALLLLSTFAALPPHAPLISPPTALSDALFVVPPREPLPPESVRFAVIGDYGLAGQPAQDVSTLVKSWDPDFIITTGDNNYPLGAESTIDANVGQYYHEFIAPYYGSYGVGAASNRFFPSLGNHDWETPGAAPYLAYFTLPGNERYYDFTWGPVHFFALDSDPREPDGISSTSTQALWLQEALRGSTAPWKIVYLHHPPYSSGRHGSTAALQWPFKEWGASTILAGHDHTYERILREDVPYFVNGLGGRNIYPFATPIADSKVRYNSDFGAMLVEASPEQMTFRFISRGGFLVDEYVLQAPIPPATPTPAATLTATALVTARPETLYLPLLRR